MATAKTYYPRPSYRFLPTYRSYHVASDSGFEFDESDIYSSAGSTRSGSLDFRMKLFTFDHRSSLATVITTMAASIPLNVPDWSKILRDENRHRRRRSIENDDEVCIDGEDRFESGITGGKLPPHEYLAKTIMVSFSVHEGIGRTLKGRDLSRVINAISERIGVLD